jgi:hypothetical protein
MEEFGSGSIQIITDPDPIGLKSHGSGTLRLRLTEFSQDCGTGRYLSSMMQTMLSPQGKRAPILAVLDLEKRENVFMDGSPN